ncbi:hypothetical protein BKA67DRAFT_652577 [Truncatella angustata]|uniref:phospholipase D n=1 Tax=Truncatella angustata TaxID=152316 RepID=A0A9P9A3L0_9PEZI|nr:uncharacterized protein BKA67DRAFT_652577 [Truncatella angustata]KAH6659345.1 hypothetical protein BKA67DRAFT_652577 [Truncatella angustata]KAH8199146.1 hypothetical protein TruAng_006677 [Truncatella angustata]
MDFFRKIGEKIEEVKDHLEHGDSDRPQEEARPQEHHEERPASRPHSRHDERPSGPPVNTNRYQSFAPQSSGGAKWYVDGASYFHAVSVALEEAQESIYILDWWLSPELYLRRPPAKNEQYRLDNMLKAAAERGVTVNVIVYKEVTQALTLNSEHTKHVLEGLHDNVKVFRHPDHGLDVDDAKADIEQAFSNLSMGSLNAFSLSKAPEDAVKSLYGSAGEVVLYWAHHEKLCLVDRKIAFMGGLDMCFGRWDTNSHPIADAHPGNLDATVFPGQDYNNARVFDFEGVDNWNHNQLDRTKNSRMGWSDISISLNGPITGFLLDHFVDRWNFIWQQKYENQNPGKYQKIEYESGSTKASGHLGGDFEGRLVGRVKRQEEQGGAHIQLCRSCTDWSSGHPTEHSIQNAYIDAIANAQHFVYIENQFFITATSDEQRPVHNKIGGAIVDRIIRAHNAREDFRVIVLMPAVPAFAGDLHSDGALGTRAIMEFQYNSINRGGHSIMEVLQQRGVEDPRRYITFYNLRNYDRINNSETLGRAEEKSGVPYEQARREYDDKLGVGNYPYGEQGEDRGRYGQEEGGESRFGGGYGGQQRGHDGEERGYGGQERNYGDRDHGSRGYGDRENAMGLRGGYGSPDREDGRRREYGGDYENRERGYSNRDEDRNTGYGERRDDRDRFGSGGYDANDRGYGERREEGFGGGYEDRRHEEFGGRRDDDFGGRRDEGERFDSGGYGERRDEGRQYDSNDREEQRDDSERYDGGRDDNRLSGGRSEGQGRTGNYERYQQAAQTTSDETTDSVAACYMEGGELNRVQWQGSPEAELDAYVSEELYIHTKVLIADDKLVICGSANLNDRSQLGDHDSEIAVVIEDPETVESTMNGQRFSASKFATSLRRQIFRKHLGLLPHQPVDKPNANWTPITQDPQQYDWGSQADRLVEDPLSSEFWELWSGTARTNTEVFNKVFHPVPTDLVRDWDQYKEFFSKYFIIPGVETKEEDKQGKVEYGHVVREEFPGGVDEVKQWLGRVRGTLVDMPLDFLIDVHELAKQGLSLNAFTDEIYT